MPYTNIYTSTLRFSSINWSLVVAIFNLVGVIGSISSHPRKVLAITQIVVRFLCDRVPYLQAIFYRKTFCSHKFQTAGFTSVWTAAAVDTSVRDPGIRSPILPAFASARRLTAIIGPIVTGLLCERSREKKIRLCGDHGLLDLTIFVGAMAFGKGCRWRGHRLVEDA